MATYRGPQSIRTEYEAPEYGKLHPVPTQTGASVIASYLGLAGMVAIIVLSSVTLGYTVEVHKKAADALAARAPTCTTVELVQHDFTKTNLNVTNPPDGFEAFAFDDFTADDGNVTQSGGYLRIDSSEFTLTMDQGALGVLDHTKWLAYLNDTFIVPEEGQLVCSAVMRVRQVGITPQPFNATVFDAENDIRLASGALGTLDPTKFITSDVFFANGKLYALYERLAFARETLGNYSAFTFVIPIQTRSVADFATVAVAWNKKERSIKWMVDGEEVFRVNRPGYKLSREFMILDHGGIEEDVFPESVKCGFGTFSLLDAYPVCSNTTTLESGSKVCNYPTGKDKGLVRLGEVTDYANPRTGAVPASFVDSTGIETNRIYGQGAILDAKSISVYTTSC